MPHPLHHPSLSPEHTAPSEGNGGKGRSYTWTQSLVEVVITIPVSGAIRGKDCEVELTDDGDGLRVSICDVEYIDGTLPHVIDTDAFSWTLEADGAGKLLTILLPKKVQLEWWSCAIKGDQEIDVTLIPPADANLKELDPHARATVEQMMRDKRAEALGLLPAAGAKQQQQQQQGGGGMTEAEKAAALAEFKRLNPSADLSGARIA